MSDEATRISERLAEAAMFLPGPLTKHHDSRLLVKRDDVANMLLDAGLREAVRICEEVPKTVSDPGMIGLAEMILAALKGEKA